MPMLYVVLNDCDWYSHYDDSDDELWEVPFLPGVAAVLWNLADGGADPVRIDTRGIDDLNDNSRDTYKRRVIAALWDLEHIDSITLLAEALSDELAYIRTIAARAFVETRNASAVPILIGMLHDDNSMMRSRAAQALGKIGAVSAVPSLSESLTEPHEDVRSAAAHALGRIGETSVVPVRVSAGLPVAFYALGRIGETSVVPMLVNALSDAAATVRSSSASALGQIGDTAAVPKLIEVLRVDSGSVRLSAAGALGLIRDPSAVPALVETLRDGDDDLRDAVVTALGRIGDAAAVPSLLEVLRGTDVALCRHTVRALERIGVAAVPALINATSDESPLVREFAAESLWSIGDSESLPRQILGASQFSIRERVDMLTALHRVRDESNRRFARYTLPRVIGLCAKIVNESDAVASAGAQEVLNWLNNDRDLLTPSQGDSANQSAVLLRAAPGGRGESGREGLLQASDATEQDIAVSSARPAFVKRLLRRRKNSAR
jgi:HEAT repeat protein